MRISVVAILVVLSTSPAHARSPFVSIDNLPSGAQALARQAEGREFATLNLKDPWDMQEYSDISQYLNSDGQFNQVQNVKVQDSVFSAQSTTERDAFFFVLYPGFYDTITAPKTGSRDPISSKDFHCLFMAMKVDSGAPEPGYGPDQLQVFWFSDGMLNTGNSPWGGSYGIQLYPEAGQQKPVPHYKLIKLDLNVLPSITSWKWADQTVWRGLRIDPTLQANVNFAVDWVRLTDCAATNYAVSWESIPGTYGLWVKEQGQNHAVRVASNVDGITGSYSLDTQGFAPGTYQIGLGSGADCCSIWSSELLEINQTPVARFTRPSFTSGIDYSATTGNPWDFSDASDVTGIMNTNWSIQNGMLELDTPSGPLPGGTDAQIHLNSPRAARGMDYRYLTLRIFTNGPWQRFGGGMVGRWIWTVPGASSPGNECHLVSQDITYDVGWQDIALDLFDPYEGSVEQKNGDCPAGPLNWRGFNSILKFRFDPNENISGSPFQQKLDWIRLTSVDQVVKGNPFPVQISLNKSPQETREATFYYTDDLNQPKKYLAESYTSTSTYSEAVETRAGLVRLWEDFRFLAFLPYALRNFSPLVFPPVTNGVNFAWDTSPVPPGEYYLCVEVIDSYNSAITCSEAPVQVVLP